MKKNKSITNVKPLIKISSRRRISNFFFGFANSFPPSKREFPLNYYSFLCLNNGVSGRELPFSDASNKRTSSLKALHFKTKVACILHERCIKRKKQLMAKRGL